MGKKEREKEKGKGESRRTDLLSPETSKKRGRLRESSEGPQPSRCSSRRDKGLHCWWRGVPEDLETLEGVAQRVGGRERGRDRRGSGRRNRKGRQEEGRSGTAAREAEAAYQAVSCGDKQSPEVIGVHAACLLLLEDAGTAEEARPRVGKRGRPMCTAGKQDSGRSGRDRGGPERPGKGEGVQRDTGRELVREPVRWHIQWQGAEWRGRQRRERERRAVNATVRWAQGRVPAGHSPRRSPG